MAFEMYACGIVTARKQSLGRLCFHRCLSVHGEGGGETVNKRAELIPLDCILVLKNVHLVFSPNVKYFNNNMSKHFLEISHCPEHIRSASIFLKKPINENDV